MSDNIPVDDIFVKLVSSDGKTFAVSLKAVKKSIMISNLLKGSNIAPSKAKIRLPKVASKELQKIVAYLEHHKNDIIDLVQLRHKLLRNQESDVGLFLSEMDKNSTLNLLMAAIYLEIRAFGMVCGQKLAEIGMETGSAEQMATFLANFPALLLKKQLLLKHTTLR